MADGVPDKLTANNSEKYIMSIRLRSDGLSFSGYCPSVGESFFCRNAEFDRTKDYITSLKEFFFEHEFLAYPYKQTNVVFVSPRYTVVPCEAFEERRLADLIRYTFSSPADRCLSNALTRDNANVVFGVDDEVYSFCARSLINPMFVHHIAPQLALWKQQSQGQVSRQMYVVVHRKIMDVACFVQGKLLFVNTFEHETTDDIIYDILYVWKQVGMDQEKDRLHIYGDMSLRTRMTGMLQNYIQYTAPAELPVEAYLLGAEMVHAPLDLAALLVCGL